MSPNYLSLGQDRLIGANLLLDTGQSPFVLSGIGVGLHFLVSTVGLQFRQLDKQKPKINSNLV